MPRRAVVLAILVLGCAGPEAPADVDAGARPATLASCDVRSMDLEGGEIHFCNEYLGPTTFELVGLRAGCEALVGPADGGSPLAPRGSFAESACTRTDAIGGCRDTTESIPTITWQYAPRSPDGYRTACERDGGVWIDP